MTLPLSAPRRKLWSMDCFTICTLISTTVSTTEMQQFCRQKEGWSGLFQTGDFTDEARLHRRIHELCHQKCAFAKAFQRLLNDRYQPIINLIAALSIEEVSRYFQTSDFYDSSNIAGFLWAVATDPRETIREKEQEILQLVRRYILSPEHYLCTPPTSNSDSISTPVEEREKEIKEKEKEIEALRTELHKIKRKLAESYAKRDQMLQEKLMLETKVFQLQQENQLLKKQTPRGVDTAVGTKKLRKEVHLLSQAVSHLQMTIQDKEKEIKRLREIVSRQREEIEGLTQQLLQHEEIQDEQQACATLCGKRIALVGGIDRLDPHYRSTIEALGAIYYRHNGNCRAGDQALRVLINKADIILFSVDCNSHGATQQVKALCKACGKPFYALYSSGVSQIKKKLLEIGGNAISLSP